MADYIGKLAELQQRLDKMVEYQGYFDREINAIRSEINALRQLSHLASTRPQPKDSQPITPSIESPKIRFESPKVAETPAESYVAPGFQIDEPALQNSQIEEFVGKNIISIIGIIITVLGVGIGAKYAIDNNLISPTTRIILGYVFAFGLLGTAFKLKKNYDRFSAVLLSGSVAIMYFLTFFAYSFYGLISQGTAFALMAAITAFTVYCALSYDRQVIAIIGLVGAYAVPFLLSDGTGRVEILFGYVAIINIGILAVSIKKYWNVLYVSAFGITWLIYLAWFLDKYQTNEHFTLALSFATLFFAIFYASFAAYKLNTRDELTTGNAILLLANSSIYFVLGYTILERNPQTKDLIGMFALANGVLHLGVAYLITKKRASKEMLYLVVALSLLFIIISVPLQMERLWTPIFWTIASVWLFWVGFVKRLAFYEVASYILMALATFAIVIYIGDNQVDWSHYFDTATMAAMPTLSPLASIPFVVGSVFVAGFGIICFLINRPESDSALDSSLFKLLRIGVSAVFLFSLYNLFRTEIGNFWHLQYVNTAVSEAIQFTNTIEKRLVFDEDLQLFNVVWQLNYSMIFLTILSFFNIKWLKNVGLGFTILALNAFVLCIFAVIGLYFISELRESFLLQTDAGKFARGNSHIVIRYISLAFAGGLVFASYYQYKQKFIQKVTDVAVIFEMIFVIALLIILSSELLNLTDIFGYKDSYKLALSLLWGGYSLSLIALGILWRKIHLRIGAIILFAITLAKLFLLDIASLSTISKTVVFVSLGVMLLIISFLYNKYKSILFGVNKPEETGSDDS